MGVERYTGIIICWIICVKCVATEMKMNQKRAKPSESVVCTQPYTDREQFGIVYTRTRSYRRCVSFASETPNLLTDQIIFQFLCFRFLFLAKRNFFASPRTHNQLQHSIPFLPVPSIRLNKQTHRKIRLLAICRLCQTFKKKKKNAKKRRKSVGRREVEQD